MYQMLNWNYDKEVSPDNLKHMDEGIYNNSLNISNYIKTNTITGTPNKGGAVSLATTTNDVYVLGAWFSNVRDGFVIPYCYRGINWWCTCRNHDNSLVTEEVEITYAYIDVKQN